MKFFVTILLLIFTMEFAHAASSIKVRPKIDSNGILTIKILITHSMETGFRVNIKTGSLIPKQYINNLEVRLNNTLVVKSSPTISISKNPYFTFKIKEAIVGDSVEIYWEDNLGNSDVTTSLVK